MNRKTNYKFTNISNFVFGDYVPPLVSDTDQPVSRMEDTQNIDIKLSAISGRAYVRHRGDGRLGPALSRARFSYFVAVLGGVGRRSDVLDVAGPTASPAASPAVLFVIPHSSGDPT